jgi:hypothetical protein
MTVHRSPDRNSDVDLDNFIVKVPSASVVVIMPHGVRRPTSNGMLRGRILLSGTENFHVVLVKADLEVYLQQTEYE